MQHLRLSYRRKTKTSILLLLILTMTFISITSIFPACAATEIYILSPVTAFSTATTPVDYKWNITVWVSEGTDVASWQVYMTYSNKTLNATRAWLPSASDPAEEYVFYGKPTVRPLPYFDRPSFGDWSVLIGDTIATTPITGVSFTTPKQLAIIELQITAPPKLGELSLDINNIDTYLLDSGLNQITTLKTNGSYSYTWSPPTLKPYLAVGPNVTYGPDPAVGQKFNIKVNITNLDENWGLDSYVNATFSLSYNATIIDVIENTTNTLWTKKTTSITPGVFTKINVFVGDPTQNPRGNVTVITIWFNVTYQGISPAIDESPLILGDVELMNFLQEIPTAPPAHGKVTIKGFLIMPLEVKPDRYITNKLEMFNVEVWLNEVSADKRLVGAQFRLLYNATLLRFVEAIEGSFLRNFNQTPRSFPEPTWFIVVQEENNIDYGPNLNVMVLIWPNSTGQWNVFPEGSGVLTRITFEGIYRGFYPEKNNCTLELVDFLLIDDKNNPITTTPTDGYYEILSYRPPKAAFTYSPSVLNATVPVVFDASTSSDFELGHIVSYTWNFGDGNTTTVTQPIVPHVYNATGTFNVNLTVTDDDGQTNSTAKSITVVKRTSTISIAVAPQIIIFSQNTIINGMINPKPREVNTVTIFHRLQGETEWQTLTTTTTDAIGKYSYLWTPTKVGTYELKASWLGDEIADQAQVIAEEKLMVKMAKGTITVNLNPSTLTVESKVTINGTVSPYRGASVNVTVSYRSRGGLWQQLATVGTDSEGNYKYIWTTTDAGVFEIRTYNAGDENAGPAQSRIDTLTINKATSIIGVNVDPETPTVGSDVTISGTIQPTRQEVNVTIYYRRLDGTWSKLAMVTTDSNSQYTYTWKTSEEGTYEVKASWSGDANTLSAESDAKRVNVEAPTNLFIYVLIAATALIAVALTLIYKKTRKSKPTLN